VGVSFVSTTDNVPPPPQEALSTGDSVVMGQLAE